MSDTAPDSVTVELVTATSPAAENPAAPAAPAAPAEEAAAPVADVAVEAAPAASSAAAAAPAASSAAAAAGAESAAEATSVVDARTAFKQGDVEASKAFHDLKNSGKLAAEEVHGGLGSEYIKSIVFGGLDGIITTFSIVAATAGASLDIKIVILMGFANVIADAISMGMGDYLSEKAEQDHIYTERKRELWEVTNHPEGEKEEMVKIYMDKGFDKEDAELIINTYTSKEKYKELFVDHMMVEELGFMTPDPEDSPLKNGFVTFFSFILFGSVPMWVYVIYYGVGYDNLGGQFGIACAITAITMFLLGFIKGRISKSSPYLNGFLMMLNGSIAAASAYLIGWGLEVGLGLDESR